MININKLREIFTTGTAEQIEEMERIAVKAVENKLCESCKHKKEVYENLPGGSLDVYVTCSYGWEKERCGKWEIDENHRKIMEGKR